MREKEEQEEEEEEKTQFRVSCIIRKQELNRACVLSV